MIPHLHLAILAAASTLLIAAALSDARRYRIPNALSLGLLFLFPAFVFTAPVPIAWDQHLVIFGLTLAGGFVLFARKFIGAGDVKLLAALSLWAGPAFIGLLLFVTAIAGGLLSLVVAALRFWHQRTKKGLLQIPVPYGIAIALGGLCTFLMLAHI